MLDQFADPSAAGAAPEPVHAAHAPQPTSPSLIETTASAVDGAASGARGALEEASRVGEKRTIAEVLIENARTLAQSEGKDLVIAEKNAQLAELRDDRGFLREEIRESRKQRDQVKDIADRMLTTLE